MNRKRIPVNGQELIERQSLDNLQKMCIKQAPKNPPTFRTESSIFAFFSAIDFHQNADLSENVCRFKTDI